VYLVTGDLKKRDSVAAVAPAYLLTKAGGRYVFSNRP
jgi:hypothetical protein